MDMIRILFALGPLWFGIGFIAPLIDQTLRVLDLSPPMAMPTLAFALIVGALLGSIATWRGRWL
mgnify:CR=1 FL=1